MPRVELASRDDVARMLRISNDAAESGHANFATEPETLEAWLAAFDRESARYPWLVTEGGFAKASPHRARGAYAWTAEVSVYVTQPRRGIGRALYDKLIPTLRAQGFATLLAGIGLPNEASVGLHEAFGFRRCAVFARVGFKRGAWRDVGYWELHLHEVDAPPGVLKPVREVYVPDPRP